MATHSSNLAWKIPWTEEPGRLQSMGSQESDTAEWLSHSQGGCPFILPVSSLSCIRHHKAFIPTAPPNLLSSTSLLAPGCQIHQLPVFDMLSSSIWHSGSSPLFQRLPSLNVNLTFLPSDWSLLLSLSADSSSSSPSFLSLLNIGRSWISNHRPHFSAYSYSFEDSSKSHGYKCYRDAEDLPQNSRLPTARWTFPFGYWTSISNLTCLKSKLPIVLSFFLSLSFIHMDAHTHTHTHTDT